MSDAAAPALKLARGHSILALPGPTNVPERVLRAMHKPAIDLYAGELLDITEGCHADMKKVFRTDGAVHIYIANGHGAWEAAISNLFSKDDLVLACKSGRFAVGWGEMAEKAGCRLEILDRESSRAADPAALEKRLKADAHHEIKGVIVAQIDTASSVITDIPAIRKAIDAAGHPALLLVDVVASLATVPFEMDAWGVDCAIAGGQKGLMMPPGLGFTAANAKALKAHETAGLRTRYWDWTERMGDEHYMTYCGTAPIHSLYGMREALDMLFEEGLEQSFARHGVLAAAVRAAVEVWTQGQALRFNATEPEERANSVTTILLREGVDPDPLRRFVEDVFNVTLGFGIGEFTGKAFRIGHMGYINAPMIMGILGAVEAGLGAVGIPHGKGGVQAAQEVIAGQFVSG